jgi:hypothetical protein
MFRYIAHGLRTAPGDRLYSTWHEASAALDDVIDRHHGQITGGHVEEHVDGIGWIVSNEEPQLSAFPDDSP